MRLRCKAFGCVWDDYSPDCIRCGTRLYDGEVLRENSWCGPLYAMIHKYKHSHWKRHHKCEVCGRSMYLTNQNCCSTECYDEWIPF